MNTMTDAEKWRYLCDLLRAQGWQNITPELIAALLPNVEHAPLLASAYRE